MLEAVEFRDFDVQDTPHYLEHVRKCKEIPFIMSPFLQLAIKDEYQIKSLYMCRDIPQSYVGVSSETRFQWKKCLLNVWTIF